MKTMLLFGLLLFSTLCFAADDTQMPRNGIDPDTRIASAHAKIKTAMSDYRLAIDTAFKSMMDRRKKAAADAIAAFDEKIARITKTGDLDRAIAAKSLKESFLKEFADETARITGSSAEQQAAPQTITSNSKPNEKQIVLSARDFNALPAFKRIIRKGHGQINYSGLRMTSADGTPLGFTSVDVGEFGFIATSTVLRVIDESTALVEIELIDVGTNLSPFDNGGPHVLRQVLIEGVPTNGQADGNPWSEESWFKIVNTEKFRGNTYVVAWPVVAGNAVQHK
jgi:hypothetical protein